MFTRGVLLLSITAGFACSNEVKNLDDILDDEVDEDEDDCSQRAS